jgi:hypothetical protein
LLYKKRGWFILITPDQVISEIQRLTGEAAKAPQAIYDAERVVADKQLAYDRKSALEFMNAQGTVADRENLAKLNAADEKFELELAKAELNRVKNKSKQLADAGVLTASIGRQVELMYRNAG